MPIQNTYPEKWYRRKKPLLQLKIINHIAIRGKSTRRIAQEYLGSYYSDIHESFRLLLENEIIKPTGEADKDPKQRASTYYRLTEKGISAFIEETPQPIEFWNAMSHISAVTKEDRIKINKYYRVYELRYLGRDKNDIFFRPSIVLFFDKIFRTLSEDIYEKEKNDEFIILRRIIDWLALKGSLDIFHLSRLLKRPKNIVMQVIKQYTLESYKSVRLGNDFDSIIKEYETFLAHMIIAVKKRNQSDTTYELSLLGIMLALKMKRWGVPQGILVDVPYSEYLSIVAQNYEDKVPLVFGKWKELIKTLGYNVEYLFEPVLYDEERQSFFNLSVRSGGNKEIYDSLQDIAIRTAKKLFRIYNEGIIFLKENSRYSEKEKESYGFISTLLKELAIPLKYLDLRNYVDSLQKQGYLRIEYEKEQNVMEIELAREITFLIYINLCKEKGYTEQWDIYQSHFLKPDISEELVLKLPLKELLSIDKEISNEISKWINYALGEQAEILNKIKSISTVEKIK